MQNLLHNTVSYVDYVCVYMNIQEEDKARSHD